MDILAVNAAAGAIPSSAFVPLAVGFYGLGVGYFVWGGSLLFGFPGANNPDTARQIDRSIGLWGIWMPGFLQFITGTYIFVGLTWLHVFGSATAKNAEPLYMAGLAFTAYGVHWFVLGARRYIQSDVIPDAWMAIPFALLSILGIIVFAWAKDWGVVILFIGLTLIYLTEAVARFNLAPNALRGVGLWQFLTGIWLMYLTYAAVLDFATTYHWPV